MPDSLIPWHITDKMPDDLQRQFDPKAIQDVEGVLRVLEAAIDHVQDFDVRVSDAVDAELGDRLGKAGAKEDRQRREELADALGREDRVGGENDELPSWDTLIAEVSTVTGNVARLQLELGQARLEIRQLQEAILAALSK